MSASLIANLIVSETAYEESEKEVRQISSLYWETDSAKFGPLPFYWGKYSIYLPDLLQTGERAIAPQCPCEMSTSLIAYSSLLQTAHEEGKREWLLRTSYNYQYRILYSFLLVCKFISAFLLRSGYLSASTWVTHFLNTSKDLDIYSIDNYVFMVLQ